MAGGPQLGHGQGGGDFPAGQIWRLLGEDEKEEGQEESARWKEFEEDVKKGRSVAFRAIKDKVQESWTGEDDVSNVALLDSQAAKWGSIWQTGRSAWDVRKAGLQVGGLEAGETLKAAELRNAAKSFKKKTTAVEGWHPRHLAAFSDDLLDRLGEIFKLFEVAVWWPSSESCLLTKLIPKPKGGLRPVMWFRTLYRVYARARRGCVQRWFTEWAAARPEVNMAPGRHTTDAIWRSMVRQDLGVGSKNFIEINGDFQKAFDFVGRGVVGQCKEARVPFEYLGGVTYVVRLVSSGAAQLGGLGGATRMAGYCGWVSVRSVRAGGTFGGPDRHS